MLLGQLPPESALATSMRCDADPGETAPDRDPESEQWSRAEHLLAAIRDEIHKADNHYLQVNFKGNPKYVPTPRPGSKAPGTKKLTPEATEYLFSYLQSQQDN